MRGRLVAVLALAALAIAAGAIALFVGREAFVAAALAQRDVMKAAADARPIAALIAFTALYVAIISVALPVGPPMSLIAGFLFGRWIGTAAVLTGATAGALVVFSAVRAWAGTPLGCRLLARAGPAGAAVAADMRANAFGYLMVARLVPFVPFVLVNVAAGLAGIPLRPFALATLLGRIPAAFLYVSLGEELGRVQGLGDLARPQVVLTLVALASLALVPVVIRHRRVKAADARLG